MPPATRTVPSDSSVAVWRQRGTFMLAAGLQRPVDGSYSSALAVTVPYALPPTASTRPSGSNVPVAFPRPSARPPVGVHVPVAGSKISVLASYLQQQTASPPAISTRPSASLTAKWSDRSWLSVPAGLHVSLAGSYTSALVPPAARTRPSSRVVSVRLSWTAAMPAVAAQVPVVAAAEDGIAKTAATSTAASGHKRFFPGHMGLSFASKAVASI